MQKDIIRAKLEPIIREVGVRETARIAGLPYANISNWLRGERPLSREDAQEILRSVRDYYQCRLRSLPKSI